MDFKVSAEDPKGRSYFKGADASKQAAMQRWSWCLNKRKGSRSTLQQ